MNRSEHARVWRVIRGEVEPDIVHQSWRAEMRERSKPFRIERLTPDCETYQETL